MSCPSNPALAAFLETIGSGRPFVQVWIGPEDGGYRLVHVDDRGSDPALLAPVEGTGLRTVAQFTSEGAFRPLKSAPNLPAGWVCRVPDAEGLAAALEHLYPGGLADWHAARSPTPPVTAFRDYVGRQTGMYRGARDLTDSLAAAAVRACCHPRFCLRRRLWPAPGLEADAADSKSDLPCLEPCAMMLEFARRTQRMERDPKVALELAPGDLAALAVALERAVTVSDPAIREGDTSSPGNPRRIQLLLEKLRPHFAPPGSGAAEE